MQKYNISFKGQNIFVGIDVHLKTWHVTTLTGSGYKYSFAQHADARELFERLNLQSMESKTLWLMPQIFLRLVRKRQ